MVSYVVWLLATRTAKLLPHLWNRPQDIIHVPAFILFGYYFAVMKLYALVTLHEVRLRFTINSGAITDTASLQTGWGTRAGIGDPTAATAAADKGGSNEKVEPEVTVSPAPRYPEPQPYQANQGYQQIQYQETSYQQTQYQQGPYRQPPVEMQEGYAR